MSLMSNSKQLHWTQRVALVRHNLHAASRSGDFGFFKTLQAAGFMEGTNHVATLSAELGDDGDIILAALDNLNAGLAYVHQDAFKNVYEKLKNNIREDDTQADKSKLHVDVAMQRTMADMSIDKITSSALALIVQQPEKLQDTAANVWITGVTIVADCMQHTLKEMDQLQDKMDDFIRLEESWSSTKSSVVCAVSGLKGVFRLMDPANPQEGQRPSPRSMSIASASGAVFRRLSSAFIAPTTSSRSSSIVSANMSANMHAHGRNSSVSSAGPVYRTPNYMRKSISDGCPTSLPPHSDYQHHKLSMIPPTPAIDDERDPFDDSVPPVPEMPEIPAMVVPAADFGRRMSLAAF